jgi:hypothetical protein
VDVPAGLHQRHTDMSRFLEGRRCHALMSIAIVCGRLAPKYTLWPSDIALGRSNRSGHSLPLVCAAGGRTRKAVSGLAALTVKRLAVLS